ncbi:MAG: MarR family transcriptional regulator [Dehalococcoidales bacterium]|nr:MAG: MarR family transcriptional regulator [Dehalococcoidales bacterium]
MDNKILERVAEDLLSIPPVIFRIVRNKFVRAALTDIGADITPHHFEIIRLLMEGGTMHVAEIGQRLEISRAQMTHLIEKLVELGIVERQPDNRDRRIINISLTQQGISLLEEHKHTVEGAVREILSFLSDEEVEALSESLRTLWSILGKLE